MLSTLPLAQALIAQCPRSLELQRPEHRSLLAAMMQCSRMLYHELQSAGVSEDMTSPPYVVAPVDASTTGIIHIGAHRGQEAPWYFAKVGRNVAWLECNPSLMPSLEANVAPYGHRCLQACLWNKAGETRTLHLTSNDNQSASIVGNLTDEARAKWANMSLAGSEANGCIQLVTTDWTSLVQSHPWLAVPTFNFLVVDTQGAEYEILEAIAQSKPNGLQQFRRLLVECSSKRFYEGQRLQSDVDSLLKMNGFVCSGIIAGDGEHSDILYVRQDCL